MRVLWLTNHVMPEHAYALGISVSPTGGWMPSLADAISASGQIELAIATNVSGCQGSCQAINNKTYYLVPVPPKISYGHLPEDLICSYQKIVEEFRPDVIHIHGTEYFHGLLSGRKCLGCPAIISIQGIIDVCKAHYWGGLSFPDLIKSRTLRDWIRLDGLIEQKLQMHRRAKWEREIFASNTAFIGRTQWDKAHTHSMNPTAKYYHCDEMLRTPFYETSWKCADMAKHTIYTSSASYPLKGFHVLLKALSLLRHDFPDIRLRVPFPNACQKEKGMKYYYKRIRSNGYACYLTELVNKENLSNHIHALNYLDAYEVVNELRKANVFVLPSYIENSPNSLAEAMLVGTPSIVSFVGGIPSMVRDGESALCFSPGDAAVLAEQIRSIFLDDGLATLLSEGARKIAIARQERAKIIKEMIEIYQSVSEINLH